MSWHSANTIGCDVKSCTGAIEADIKPRLTHRLRANLYRFFSFSFALVFPSRISGSFHISIVSPAVPAGVFWEGSTYSAD